MQQIHSCDTLSYTAGEKFPTIVKPKCTVPSSQAHDMTCPCSEAVHNCHSNTANNEDAGLLGYDTMLTAKLLLVFTGS